MAVKVMVAPAIASGAIEKGPPARKREAAAAPKPKRRRSSVYDADGNEVFITLMCLKCHKMRPLSQFGLRRMADGAIRNQPWCRTCRSGASADEPKRRKARRPGSEADARAGLAALGPEAAAPRDEKVVDPGTLAAQVVAALHGGARWPCAAPPRSPSRARIACSRGYSLVAPEAMVQARLPRARGQG